MKRLTTLLAALVIAALPALAQNGSWQRASVTPYGTGRTTNGDVLTEHVYSNGNFNSEMKSNSGKFVYFRKGFYNEPASQYRPGQTFTVNMRLTLKRHSGNGKPSGTAGADIVAGVGGKNTTISPDLKLSGKDEEKSTSVQLTIPTRAAAGKDQMSIVYQCLDMTIVYLYNWVPDQQEKKEEAMQQEAPKQKAQPQPETKPQPAATPAADEPAAEEEPDLSADDSAYDWDEPAEGDFDDDDWDDFDKPMTEEDMMKMMAGAAKDAVKEKVNSSLDKVLFSAFGKDFTMKETLIYGGGGLLGLILLLVLLLLLFRSNPQKKAAKQAAKQAAAQQAAQMRAQQQAARAEAQRAQQEAMAARKAEMEAKRAEAMKAQQEAAAARKAEMEAKRAEAMKAQQERRAAAMAATQARQAAGPAPQGAPQGAPMGAAAPQAQPQPAPAPAPAPQPASAPAPAPVIPSEAKESSAPRFCENCGAKLDPDAAFCPECGTKVQ